jgi:excisionase family DNA binding protein
MIELRIERGFVTASVAASLLGVSRQRVHQLLKAGRIRGAFLMDCGDGRELWCVPRKELKQKQETKQ